MQIETLTMQLRNMRRNFEIKDILKRRNFEADTKRGDANRGNSVQFMSNFSSV